MSKIKVVMLEPEKRPYVKEIGNDLRSMQAIVGGLIEAVYCFEEAVCIVCNEKGKINGMPLNRAVYDEDGDVMDVIAGPAFVCDCSGEDFGSLSSEQIRYYLNYYRYCEAFLRVDDGIYVVKYEEK